MYDEDMNPEFASQVDELKQEVGCIATFLPPEALRRMIDATKTTGPALSGQRYETLALDALNMGDRASAIGFLLMAECNDAIDEEARRLEGPNTDEYHPVDNRAFGKRRGA